jgi:hypothetical protein
MLQGARERASNEGSWFRGENVNQAPGNPVAYNP